MLGREKNSQSSVYQRKFWSMVSRQSIVGFFWVVMVVAETTQKLKITHELILPTETLLTNKNSPPPASLKIGT